MTKQVPYTKDNCSYIKVTVTWTRVSDANTWGKLNTKVVAVMPATENYTPAPLFSGENIQSANELNSASAGQINSTPFKFVKEKPVDLYKHTDAELEDNPYLNNTGIIFYNLPKTNDSNGRVFVRPYSALQNGQRWFEIPENGQTGRYFDVINSNKDYYYLEYDTVNPEGSTDDWVIDKTKYQIKTYFRESDENIIYLYKNPDIDISLKSIVDATTFSDTVTQRAVKCVASYSQDDYVQWKSYQWVLYDENGSKINQTEITYDNLIEGNFYGLENGKEYTVALIIETNYNSYIVQTKTFNVSFEVGEDLGVFSIDGFSCDRLCVEVFFQGKIESEGETTTYDNINHVSIYKKEYWLGSNGIYTAVGDYQPVVVADNYFVGKVGTSSGAAILDFNIHNHTYYKYLVRYYNGEDYDTSYEYESDYIAVNWEGWSLTELSLDSDETGVVYLADTSKQWLFKYNISTGQQTQNISRTQQDNLSVYPKFVQGPKNAISGQVTCLLGVDAGPSDYYVVGNKIVNYGGYQEQMPILKRKRGNQPLDILEQWRDFFYSGQPKLLRDTKGQTFIVQLTENSNQVQEGWSQRPEEISFAWMQIDNADGVRILKEGWGARPHNCDEGPIEPTDGTLEIHNDLQALLNKSGITIIGR